MDVSWHESVLRLKATLCTAPSGWNRLQLSFIVTPYKRFRQARYGKLG